MKAAAPGKLFLLGEYAVLQGVPAALLPVKQQANVSLSETDPGLVTTRSDNERRLTSDEALEQLPLLAAVIRELNAESKLAAGHLLMDTSAFYQGDQKLGLGSSAALTAALTRLFLPDAEEPQLLSVADAAHRRFQGGAGSGADVALSVYRRPIVFQSARTPVSMNLPDNLHMLAIWTGTAASTVNYVNEMQTWQQAQPDRWAYHLESLADTVDEFIAAAANADTRQILATIDQYGRQLSLLSIESGVNFYTDVHAALQKKVESARCIYKPSGAGGGDFGIAFSADRNELKTLAEEMERENRYAFFLD